MNKVDFERLINLQGRNTTFSHQGGASVVVLAHVRRARNSPEFDNISGGMVENTFMVICSVKEMDAATWGSPVGGDRVQFDGEWHLVNAVYPLFISQVLVGYRIQVQG